MDGTHQDWFLVQKKYQDDYIASKPTHSQYLTRLQKWREKFEKQIDAKPLVILSHYLAEFQYSKVDEIEVLGQYDEVRSLPLLHHHPLTRYIAERFWPTVRQNYAVRSNGSCWKRLALQQWPFQDLLIVQIPPPSSCSLKSGSYNCSASSISWSFPSCFDCIRSYAFHQSLRPQGESQAEPQLSIFQPSSPVALPHASSRSAHLTSPSTMFIIFTTNNLLYQGKSRFSSAS